MRGSTTVLSLVLLMVALAAGCGSDGVSEGDVAAELQQHVPNASNIRCSHTGGDQFACDATINGEPTTFSVVANGEGVGFNQGN
jgi:hypothetical protein